MNKTEFLKTLEMGLKKHKVHDIDEIISDYEEHFNHQKEINKSEEDTSKSLGDINSIILEYAGLRESKKRGWFDLVAINMLAIPLLITHYGFIIILAAMTLASWSISIYYLFQMDSLSFLPFIPFGIHLMYVLSFLVTSILFFSLTVNDGYLLKSMSKQYIVKQTIRIGNPYIPKIYKKLTSYSLYVFIILFVLTYVLSAIVAKDFQYWHAWEWFQ